MKQPVGVFIDKKSGLVYSLFLALGAVTLFVFTTTIYTLIQGLIWEYSASYLLGVGFMSLAVLISCILFFITCVGLTRNTKYPLSPGSIGCVLLVVFPSLLLILDENVSTPFDFLILLIVPCIIVLVTSSIFWKKQKRTSH